MYGKKVIKRDIYQIIIPMILENILQISANLVITAMVGRLLANDISAQGICIRITDTLWCFYKGVAIGATVLIARAYGAGRHQDCRKIAEQTILTEMIIVFVFQVVLYFKAPLFLGFFSKDPQILSLAEGYMKTIIFEFPFVVITQLVQVQDCIFCIKRRVDCFEKYHLSIDFSVLIRNVSMKSILQEFRQHWKLYSGRFLLSF